MTKRERIEDLGRLSVMLSKIISDDLFDTQYWRRPKDAWDAFSELNEEKKEECIRSLAYGIDRIGNELHDCLSIAHGDDE